VQIQQSHLNRLMRKQDRKYDPFDLLAPKKGQHQAITTFRRTMAKAPSSVFTLISQEDHCQEAS